MHSVWRRRSRSAPEGSSNSSAAQRRVGGNGQRSFAALRMTTYLVTALGIEILVVILALGRKLRARVGAGFGILEDFPLVVANHDLLVVVIKDVTRIDWNFAAAAGGV